MVGNRAADDATTNDDHFSFVGYLMRQEMMIEAIWF
jgi:hypothetical protein